MVYKKLEHNQEYGVNTMLKPQKSYLSALIGAMLASSAATAGGFSLYTEGSGASIGNFAAGAAASVQDASTGWYNPAGLPFLNQEQVVFGGVGVFPKTELSGNTTFSSTGLPSYTQNFTNLDGGQNAFVPSFHYSLPINDRVAFGVSMVSPFGLSTEYGVQSPVRYEATFTELLTVNLSPEFGAKLTEHFAVGAGLDLQWSQVKFNRVLGAPILMNAFGFPATTLDSLSYNKGHSTGVGFHVGALTSFNDNHTRVGLNYQSRVAHRFRGFSELRGPLADPNYPSVNPNPLAANQGAKFRNDALTSNRIYFPDVVTLSAYHDVNEKWALMGSAIYTNWSLYSTTQLNNVSAFASTAGQVVVSSITQQNYRDAWRFAVGADYKHNEQWLFRAGVGYDETPTNDIDRDVRLPDADRIALSAGGHYQYNNALGFDLGYTYLFAHDRTNINKTDAIGTTSTFNVNASGKPHAHLVGLQLTYTMDKPVIAKTK